MWVWTWYVLAFIGVVALVFLIITCVLAIWYEVHLDIKIGGKNKGKNGQA